MWPDEIHRELAAAQVRIVGYVPDAGHKRLIELCQADQSMRAVVLTTEEEGVGLAAGAWLGGERSVLLMQSSGVGNIISALGTIRESAFRWSPSSPWAARRANSTPGRCRWGRP